MLSSSQLDALSRLDVRCTDISTLVDVNNVEIDRSSPPVLRMQSYLEAIKNPYVFLCGKTPVQLSFQTKGKRLEQLLADYFSNLINE